MIRDSIYYVLGRGGAAFITLASVVLYTHLASATTYGAYALGISISALLNAGFFIWLRVTMKRFMASEKEDVLLGTVGFSFGIHALLIIPAAFVFYVCDRNFSGGGPVILGITVLCLTQSWYELCLDIEAIHLSPRRYGSLTIGRAIGAIILGSLGLLFMDSPLVLFYTMSLAQLAATIPTCIRYGSSIASGFDKECWRRLWRFGYPLIFSAILGAASVNIDRILIAKLLGDAATAHYAVATDLPKQALTIIVQSAALAAYPAIVIKLEREGYEKAFVELRKNFDLIALVTGFIMTLLFVLYRDIVTSLLAKSFQADALSIMPIAICATGCLVWRMYYYDQALQLAHKTSLQVLINIVVLLLFVFLIYSLVPVYGILGATYAFLIVHAFGLCLSVMLSYCYFRVPVQGLNLFKIVVVGLLLALVMNLLGEAHIAPVLNAIWRSAVAGTLLVLLYWAWDIGSVRTMTQNFLRERHRAKRL